MGLTRLDIDIANPSRPKNVVRLQCLIDSGAVHSVVPTAVLRRLGIKPQARDQYTLVDGRKVVRKRGVALFKYGKRCGGADVIFGKRGDSTLLGVLTLEALGFSLDPRRGRLRPLPMLMSLTPSAS